MRWFLDAGNHEDTPHAQRVDRVDLDYPAIAVLSIGYRPLGSCPRAAGWNAATLRHGP